MQVEGLASLESLLLREVNVPFIIALLLSFVQGALIGLEREKAKVDLPEEERHRADYPGLRTFSLISLSGCLSGAILGGPLRLPDRASWFVFVCMTAFVIVLSLLFAAHRFFRGGFVGMTTNVTMPIAFLVGLMTGYGYILEALGVTFLVSFVLSMRRVAAKLVERLTYEEYTSGLELGLIAFIIGPVVYALKPVFLGVPLWSAYLYLLVALSVSYLSYMAYKLLGRRSLGAVSVLGGMVNSEATFVNVAKYARGPSEAGSLLLYVLLGFSIRGLIVVSLSSFAFMGVTGTVRLLKLFAPCYMTLLAVVVTLLAYRRMRVGVESESIPVVRSPSTFVPP